MQRRMVIPLLFTPLLLLAPVADAQLGTSSNYQLAQLALDGGGGGTCSLGYASWIALSEIASDQLLSANFQARVGFLAGSDPKPSSAPVVFGVTPNFGPKAGGSTFVISGLNFDKFGTGPALTVKVGGNLAPSTVDSNTQITATAPPGFSGPRTLTVTNPFGSWGDPAGFIYTPAVTTTPIVPIGSNLAITNYGPVGDTYRTYVSSSSWAAMTQYGTLLIGPSPLILLLPNYPYPGPDGVDVVNILVPNDPVLHGLVVYFQSLSITNPSPLAGSLTNASTMAIP